MRETDSRDRRGEAGDGFAAVQDGSESLRIDQDRP